MKFLGPVHPWDNAFYSWKYLPRTFWKPEIPSRGCLAVDFLLPWVFCKEVHTLNY